MLVIVSSLSMLLLMSSKRTAALSGLVAAVVAIGLILAAIYVPGTGIGKPNSSQGTLSVLLTDPPTVPENVSAVYITYSQVQVHIADAGNQSGWYSLTGSGEINLMSVVNVSQTIANANLPAGNFNGFRFNVTQVVVTYNNVNYTGLMIYNHNTLYTWIPGGISVSAAQSSAALIDLAPTVILAGTPQNPTFVFIPASKGFVIPSSAIPAQSRQIGERHQLEGNSWWSSIEAGTKFGISKVLLTPNSLQITVTNEGSSSVDLRLAGVATQNSVSGGFDSLLKASDVFVVENNGTLVNMNSTSLDSIESQVAGAGLLLAPGASVTLTYSGTIQIGLQMYMHFHDYGITEIAPQSMYMSWVQGNAQIASAGVLAS